MAATSVAANPSDFGYLSLKNRTAGQRQIQDLSQKVRKRPWVVLEFCFGDPAEQKLLEKRVGFVRVKIAFRRTNVLL